MDALKDISHAGFEWQRTEGRLNEIGLKVSVEGQLRDGLVKRVSFLEPPPLCFSEGKPDKGLGAGLQSRGPPAGAGHRGHRCVGSGCGRASERSSGHQKAAPCQPEPGEGPDANKAASEREPVAGEEGPDLELPGAADLPRQGPETSVWKPSAHPAASGGPGSRTAAPGPEQGAAPGRQGGGETWRQREPGSALPLAVAPTAEHPPTAMPPVTPVEGPQDQELERRGSPEEGALFPGAQPKKAVRRALSECSHLAVPPAVSAPGGELPPGPQPLPSSPEPVPAPRTRGAPAIGHAMTVAEEPLVGCRSNPRALPTLATCGEAAAEREESGPSGRHRHSATRQGPCLQGEPEPIPRVSGRDQGQEDARGARTEPCPPVCRTGEQQPGWGALAGEQQVGVPAAQSAPLLLCEETPRDGMSLTLPPWE